MTKRDVDTVSKQQNEEKFGEIGEEQVKPRALGGSVGDLVAHERPPKCAQNDPETAKNLFTL